MVNTSRTKPSYLSKISITCTRGPWLIQHFRYSTSIFTTGPRDLPLVSHICCLIRNSEARERELREFYYIHSHKRFPQVKVTLWKYQEVIGTALSDLSPYDKITNYHRGTILYFLQEPNRRLLRKETYN